jgi:hypothetical protein
MIRRCRLSFVLVLIAAATALAQTPAKPNLTGIWIMDVAKSSFGGLEAPQSARYLIRHLGAKIEMQYEVDGHVTRVDVTPDGEEHLLESLPESENLARVYWLGAVLVFEGRIKPTASSNAPVVKWTSRWSLSEDKKTLTIDRHITSQQTSVEQKVVFEKQPPQVKTQ